MNGGFDFEIFCNRIPCLESALSATDSKIRSNPPATVQSASRSGSAARPLLRAHPPFQVPTPRRAQRGKLRVQGLHPKDDHRRAQSRSEGPTSAPAQRRKLRVQGLHPKDDHRRAQSRSEGPTPAPAQRPKLKRLAALFHTPPQRPLFPICDSFRAPPPRPLSPIWTPRLKPATAKRAQSWAGSPRVTQSIQIQAAPILARIESRSWTAPPQAQSRRKNAKKQSKAIQTPRRGLE